MAAQLKPLQQASANKIFCAASIPSASNPNGGHAVALIIDHTTKSITYNDPYGTPPPAELNSALQTLFPAFTLEIDANQQQYDQQSCALITAMNLAGYAKDQKPDPNIQDKLWGIRIRHAPQIIELLKKETIAEAERQKTAGPSKSSNGFKVIDEEPSKLGTDGILEAFNDRDPSRKEMPSNHRFVITLAKLGEPT